MAMTARMAWLTACLLAPASGYPAEVLIEPCQRVEVSYPQPGASLMADRVGAAVCAGLQRLGPLFKGSGRSKVRVRILADMKTFYKLSGRPWYVSAVVLGDRIVTQPVRSLMKLSDLQGTLVHELVHLLIRRSAGRNCPRWLEEGLAQRLSGQKSNRAGDPDPRLPADRAELEKLEKRLKSPAIGREQLKKDYRTSLLLTGRLIDRVGERTLIKALGGLKTHPDPLKLPVNGKPLDTWIFHLDE